MTRNHPHENAKTPFTMWLRWRNVNLLARLRWRNVDLLGRLRWRNVDLPRTRIVFGSGDADG
jgi:hypothetical protein